MFRHPPNTQQTASVSFEKRSTVGVWTNHLSPLEPRLLRGLQVKLYPLTNPPDKIVDN
jgi:hypothetical protein